MEAQVSQVTLHVYLNGNAHTFDGATLLDRGLELGNVSPDERVIEVAEQLTGQRLTGFVVDRNETSEALNLTVRPTAVWG